MAFCLGRLRLAPAAFWALTPREIVALLPAPTLGAPDRAALAALMAAHPDTPES